MQVVSCQKQFVMENLKINFESKKFDSKWVRLMKEVLSLKFSQDAACRKALVDTNQRRSSSVLIIPSSSS